MSVHRGDIYFVNLNPTVGREQAGQRPVLVLSVDEINAQPLVVTVIVSYLRYDLLRACIHIANGNLRLRMEKIGMQRSTQFNWRKTAEKTLEVYYDVAAVLYDFGRQPRASHDFFVKYQDRILFGKDSYQPDEYPYYWRVFETADEYQQYLLAMREEIDEELLEARANNY